MKKQMMDALSYRNQKDIIRLLIGFSLLLGVMRFWYLLEKTSRRPPQPVTKDEILFLPSPLESELLGPAYKIWPGVFRAEAPIVPERVPELYSAASRAERIVGWNAEGLARARAWSVAMNSGNRLRARAMIAEVLPDPVALLELKIKGKTKGPIQTKRMLDARTCSLIEQEALYRWTQLDNTLRDPYVKYLQDCQVTGVFKDWVQLQSALENHKDSQFTQVVERLRLRSLVPDPSWNRWFAEKAVKYAELATRRDSDPPLE